MSDNLVMYFGALTDEEIEAIRATHIIKTGSDINVGKIPFLLRETVRKDLDWFVDVAEDEDFVDDLTRFGIDTGQDDIVETANVLYMLLKRYRSEPLTKSKAKAIRDRLALELYRE